MPQQRSSRAAAPPEPEEEAEMPTMQKVAVLCVALGQETAGELMKHLTDFCVFR